MFVMEYIPMRSLSVFQGKLGEALARFVLFLFFKSSFNKDNPLHCVEICIADLMHTELFQRTLDSKIAFESVSK